MRIFHNKKCIGTVMSLCTLTSLVGVTSLGISVGIGAAEGFFEPIASSFGIFFLILGLGSIIFYGIKIRKWSRQTKRAQQDLEALEEAITKQDENKHYEAIKILSDAIDSSNTPTSEMYQLRGKSKQILGDTEGATIDCEKAKELAEKKEEIYIDMEQLDKSTSLFDIRMGLQDIAETFNTALKSGDIATLKSIEEMVNLESIIQKGTLVLDQQNNTPLHLAVQLNQYEIAEYLVVTLHANPNIRNLEDETPYMIAMRTQNSKIMGLLRTRGGARTDQFELYAPLIEQSPRNVEFYYWRGEDRVAFGDQTEDKKQKERSYQEAMADMDKVLQIIPGYPSAVTLKSYIDNYYEERRQKEGENIQQREEAEPAKIILSEKVVQAEEQKHQGEPKQISLIPHDQLQLGELLGEGGFGVVYKGMWKYGEVAIKQLKIAKISADAIEELKREASIMAESRHPNIIGFYGISINPSGRYSMVMEYMSYGSLYDILHSQQLLDWAVRYSIAKDITSGLAILHSKCILHRDLKSLNVLLDERRKAKLTDFGLSRIKSETTSISSVTAEKTKQSVGTIPWMAPELFERRARYTTKADMYSYGMVLWELASREVPFSEAGNQAIVMNWVQKGEREDIPEDCPPSFAKLIRWCWEQDPEKRPTIDEAASELIPQEDHTTTSASSVNAKHYQNGIDSGSGNCYRMFSDGGRKTTTTTSTAGSPPYRFDSEATATSEPSYQYKSTQ